jgi:hypothetical protein
MKAETLRVNQLSPEGYAWYLRYLDALDARDVARYGTFLAEACELRFNNADPVRGRDAVLGGLGQYWQSFAALEHELLNIYGSDRAFMLEALNHYRRHDGRAVTLRAVALTDRNDARRRLRPPPRSPARRGPTRAMAGRRRPRRRRRGARARS